MVVLVFNGGSSSLTYRIFKTGNNSQVQEILKGKAHRVGVQGTKNAYLENTFENNTEQQEIDMPDHATATALAAAYIKSKNIRIDCIGHRFVHGGANFTRCALINPESLARLEACIPLAPLHNPICLAVIHKALEIFPEDVRQYVAADSAFHADLPPCAYHYPLPRDIIEKYGFRKYGFHGLSYASIVRSLPQVLDAGKEAKIIACHLGTGGASVAAIRGGKAVDTTMGFSPLPGLVMSTRSGDINISAIIYLMQKNGCSADDMVALLNHKSGLLGLSGVSSDINDIIELAMTTHDERASLAVAMYISRIRKYIGSYFITLGCSMDALVFTDDVGMGSPFVREQICKGMQWAGISLDKQRNEQAAPSQISVISAPESKVKILCVPTREEETICHEVLSLAGGAS